MIKPNRIAQGYGYLVCLTAVITVLICSSQLINALLEKSDPMHARERMYGAAASQNLTTFESYRLEKLRMASSDSVQRANMPNETTLRIMYEAERNDVIAAVNHRTTRDAIVNSILLVLAVFLFVFHWRWLRRMATQEAQE